MLNKITNIQELRAEKARFQLKKIELEETIKNDFQEIKDSINPLQILRKKLHSVPSSNEGKVKNSFIQNSLGIILSLILTKTFFRKSSLLKKMLIFWLVPKYGAKIILNNKDLIISGIKYLVNKIRHCRKTKSEIAA